MCLLYAKVLLRSTIYWLITLMYLGGRLIYDFGRFYKFTHLAFLQHTKVLQ